MKNIIAGGIVVLVIGKHTLTLKNVLFAQTKSMRKVCVRTITNNGDEQKKVVSFGRQNGLSSTPQTKNPTMTDVSTSYFVLSSNLSYSIILLSLQKFMKFHN